ncbi:unnamed protein product [Porites lobata]|uniref:Uncharacterized protein n=1 Tax=Porites lobata TaxID=104759 RepID=A0ABN8QGM2_9CNID|nr:unnamed protein product [Porites lobata]
MVIPYIMNKFPISHDVYHELTQQEPERPRGYLIKGCQQSLDDQWEIKRPQGSVLVLNLPSDCQTHVNILELQNSVEDEPTVKVKLSGDGAQISHSSSLYDCSFALLEESQNMLSSAGMFSYG